VYSRPTCEQEAALPENRVQFVPKQDLPQDQCSSLTTYVANLSEAQSDRPASLNQAESVQRGDLVQFLESFAAPSDAPVSRYRRNFRGGGLGAGGGGFF